MKASLLKKFSIAFGFAAMLVAANTASAVHIPYTVNTMAVSGPVTTPGNNPFGGFYKFDVPSTESGSAASTFSTVISNSGLTATITWSGLQPILSSFILKAGNSYDTWNISNFNAHAYNSLVVTNLSLLTPNGKNIAEISHLEFSGNLNPGDVPPPSVPDGGSTTAMLGLGILALAALNRKFNS